MIVYDDCLFWLFMMIVYDYLFLIVYDDCLFWLFILNMYFCGWKIIDFHDYFVGQVASDILRRGGECSGVYAAC